MLNSEASALKQPLINSTSPMQSTPLTVEIVGQESLQTHGLKAVAKACMQGVPPSAWRFDMVINTALAYGAAIKGAMGAAALIELIAGQFCDLSLEACGKIVFPVEIATAIFLAIPLSLPFYQDNVHQGLVALGITHPMNIKEQQERDAFKNLSCGRYSASLILAAFFGLTQLGLVGTTFYLSSLSKVLGINPLSFSALTVGGFLALANFVIGAPKGDKAITIAGTLSHRDKCCAALAYMLPATIAVAPNVLGSGGLFFGPNRLTAVPGTGLGRQQDIMLQMALGLIMSVSPLGLNVDELQKLFKDILKTLHKARGLWKGYAAAFTSSILSCIFTFVQIIKTFDKTASRTAAVPMSDSMPLNLIAGTITLVNMAILTINKGRSFNEKYEKLTEDSTFFEILKHIYGPVPPAEHEERLGDLESRMGELIKAPENEVNQLYFKHAFVSFFHELLRSAGHLSKSDLQAQKENLQALAEAVCENPQPYAKADVERGGYEPPMTAGTHSPRRGAIAYLFSGQRMNPLAQAADMTTLPGQIDDETKATEQETRTPSRLQTRRSTDAGTAGGGTGSSSALETHVQSNNSPSPPPGSGESTGLTLFCTQRVAFERTQSQDHTSRGQEPS
jgi:hypothetical protein